MEIGAQVSVAVTVGPLAGRHLLLDVEEFCPFEPSAYAWTPGWNCAVKIHGETVWFFVDEAGRVWTDNYDCGICPEQEQEFESWCERMDIWG